jgi:hypothetical protein
MPKFIVAYDLIGEGRNRDPIEKVVHDLALTVQLSESAYLVNVGDTAEQLFERFAKHTDDNDRLTVFEVSGSPVFKLPTEDRTALESVLETDIGDEN